MKKTQLYITVIFTAMTLLSCGNDIPETPEFAIVKKIAIIGLMLNMRSFSSSKSIRDITYINATEVLNNLAKELKTEQKCDLVIALSHCGLYTGREGNPSDEQIAPLTEHVDIIVGGHSHTYMEEMLTVKNKVGKDVLIVQDGAMGDYIGRLDLYW